MKAKQESIALCEQTKNRWGLGTAYSFLGEVYIAEGQYTAAKIQLHKSLEIFREYYPDALRFSFEAEAIPIALDALLGLAILQEQAGKSENALMLCEAILNHPSSEDETKVRAEQLCAALEPKLTSEQLRAARTTATRKTFVEIVKVALKTA